MEKVKLILSDGTILIEDREVIKNITVSEMRLRYGYRTITDVEFLGVLE